MQEIISEIFSENLSNKQFEDLCIDVFQFQYNNCTTYFEYCNFLNKSPLNVKLINDIPFLPIDFFKTRKIVSSNSKSYDLIFKSSGTENSLNRSSHFIIEKELYNQSILKSFENNFGPISEYSFLALLPNYLENQDSSLIYMIKLLMDNSRLNHGFYINDFNSLYNTIYKNENANVKTILFGVSFALIDFSEYKNFNFKNTIIIETGGMKGKRKEIVKTELHQLLKNNFNIEKIYSEYSMTELLSQAYTDGHSDFFSTPKWMKILIRDINDPFSYIEHTQTGGINIIDLANIYSCSFIETKDLGKSYGNKFEVLGRFDNSDIRGCNLLYYK